MLKPFVSPRWLGWHTLLVVALGGLGWLGWWQLDSARAQGDWQNYGYALQWWLFGGFAIFLWVKLVLDELDPTQAEPAEPEEPLAPVVQRQAAVAPEAEDDELAAYNRHLAWLAERSDR